MIVLVVMASACGGSASDTATTGVSDSAAAGVSDSAAASDVGPLTFTIGDVVVTLEVPDGAVPALTEIEIKAGDVPTALAQMSDLTVYAFDLEPSGLEFSEPATITFRLAAPGDTGIPLAFVIIEDTGGTATFLSAEATRHGNQVEVTALVDHFSEAYLVLADGTEVILTPELLQMREGESERSEIKFRDGRDPSFANFSPTHHYFFDEGFNVNVLPVASEFITVIYEEYGTIEVTCLKETNGVIENAYEAIIYNKDSDHQWADNFIGRLAGASATESLRLLGDVDCDPAPDSTTTTTGPPAPEELQAAMPVTVTNNGNGQIDIEFAGNVRVFTLTLAEGGVVHRFDVTVHVFGEGGLRVTGNVRTTDGEAVVDGRSVQDAGPTDDGKGVKTVTESAEVVWELIDDNHVRITITPIEGVTWPDTTPQWTVLVQKTSDSPAFTFSG